jgi:hypothetical protein
MNKLKNKTFNGIYRINILEEGTKYELEDSIVLKGIETYQLFTTQESLDVLKINNAYHIDGEYSSNHIDIVPIIEEVINVNKISIIYDKDIDQIAAFSIKSNAKNYFFIRYSDELNVVEKNEYEKLTSNIKKIETIEI